MRRWIVLTSILTIAGCMGGKGLRILTDEEFKDARRMEMRQEVDRAYSTYLLLSKKYGGPDRAFALTGAADVSFFYFYPDSNGRAFSLEEEAYKLDRKGDYLYRLGVFAEASGNTEKAAEYYEKYVLEYPEGKYVQKAMEAVERIFPLNYKEGDAATFDGGRVTLMELEKEIEATPVFLRGKYQTPEGKRELLRSIIERKLIVMDALNRKFHHSSTFQRKFREDLKDLVARTYFTEVIQRSVSVDSSEVDSLYRAHREAFKLRPYIKAIFVAWEDSTKAPEDSVFKGKPPRTILPKDSVLFNQLIDAQEGSILIKRLRDTLFAIKVEKVQKGGYKPLSEVYITLENQLKNEKVRRKWETLLDSLTRSYGFRFVVDTFGRQIPDTIAVIDSLGYWITKDVYMYYLNNRVPPLYRKAFLEGEGIRRLTSMIAQRELIYRYASTYDRTFLRAYSDMKKIFEKDLSEFYKDSILSSITATEEEIKNYYETHKANYSIPASARIRRIVVSDAGTASKLYRLLRKNPEKMDSLARIYTEIETERKSGGFKIVTSRQDARYVEKLSRFRPGKVYRFKYDGKWHIVKVNEYNPSRVRPLEEVRRAIERRIIAEKRNKAWKEYVDRMFQEYHVKILLEEDKKG